MNIEPRGQLHQSLFALDRSQCHFGLKYRRMIAAGSLRHGSPSFQAISSLVMNGVATYPVASKSGSSSSTDISAQTQDGGCTCRYIRYRLRGDGVPVFAEFYKPAEQWPKDSLD